MHGSTRRPSPPAAGSYDFIVVGGGTAGCVVAARLAAAGARVCLLEAGPPDRSLALRIPAGFVRSIDDEALTWRLPTEPHPATGHRELLLRQGKVLGGTSAINGMVYVRGQAADYDHWAALGNRGWSYAEVLPFFRRSERYVGGSASPARGQSGEFAISDNDWENPLTDAFLAAAETAGIKRNSGYNDGEQAGCGYYQRFIHRGWRVSTSSAMRKALRGVDIRVRTKATRILLDGRRAHAVLAEREGRVEMIEATREIILCAGTIHTPLLLQLSGIGSPDLLARLGLSCLVPLRAVGRHLQDHCSVRLVALACSGVTINEASRGFQAIGQALRWIAGRPSILAVSPAMAFAFASTLAGTGRPDIQCFFSPAGYRKGYNAIDREPSVTCGVYPLRPASRGFVEAASADFRAKPRIQPNYLDHPDDRAALVRGVRLARSIFAASPLRECLGEEMDPGKDVQTDDEITDFARRNGTSSVHLAGTARMGPDPADAVVDSALRVWGCEGLRVADASVMPSLVSGNTAAPTLMIAERAATFIEPRA